MMYLILGELFVLSFLLRPQFCDAMTALLERDPSMRPWHIHFALWFGIVIWPATIIAGIALGIIAAVKSD